MPRYLISFDHGAMVFPKEDLPDVARASIDAACRRSQEVRVIMDDPDV